MRAERKVAIIDLLWLMEGWSVYPRWCALVLHREKVDYESRKKGSLMCWLPEGWSV